MNIYFHNYRYKFDDDVLSQYSSKFLWISIIMTPNF